MTEKAKRVDDSPLSRWEHGCLWIFPLFKHCGWIRCLKSSPSCPIFFESFFFAGGIKFLDSWALLKNDHLCLADFWCLDWKNQSKAIPLCRLMLWWCDFKDTRKAVTDISLSLKFIISPWRIPSFIKNQSISQTWFWNANPGIRIKK